MTADLVDLDRLVHEKAAEDPRFAGLLEAALAKRLAFVNANREALLEAWVAQHGWHPDECMLMQQDMGDGRLRMWVEKRGEFEELKRLRAAADKVIAYYDRDSNVCGEVPVELVDDLRVKR